MATTPPPYEPGPQQPVGPAVGKDRTTMWGVLGIIFALCCGPLGVVFGVLSLMNARRVGRQPTLGIIAIVIAALTIIGNIVANAKGAYRNVY
ncbi:DUF4190 domain-containing protein [Actinocatenispora rupis]|uniref:DUF4190 domain-containing protein n=1 Tax=Actinocatenispora rupis TaxID=519421 RepID=A0A8J3J787_9ACTN|nr:DUF4190 domain-containing protein [Actinocatenispora rupis]GID11364.1 hypothetical protein Aru02nite_22530 [Actinocatenispora rupis]